MASAAPAAGGPRLYDDRAAPPPPADLEGEERPAIPIHVVLQIENFRETGAGGFEFGLAGQRIQQDAVPAALNDDNWWFPTGMRGQVAWFGWGSGDGLEVRVSGFRERRDGLESRTYRTLFELSYAY